MNERYITLSNKLVYYFIAPCLLLYFIAIDSGIITSSFGVLAVFGVAILLGVGIPAIYKKKNPDYKFNISSKYANAMAILVILELTYNMSK